MREPLMVPSFPAEAQATLISSSVAWGFCPRCSMTNADLPWLPPRLPAVGLGSLSAVGSPRDWRAAVVPFRSVGACSGSAARRLPPAPFGLLDFLVVGADSTSASGWLCTLPVRPILVLRLLTRALEITPSWPAANQASSTAFRFASGFCVMKSLTKADLFTGCLDRFAMALSPRQNSASLISHSVTYEWERSARSPTLGDRHNRKNRYAWLTRNEESVP